MLERSQILAVTLLVVVLGTLVAACNGDSDGSETPTGEPPATETATPGGDIRDETFTDQPGLSEFLANTGGTIEMSRVLYADLTGSGTEEAIVPVSSGGEGGDIAIFVYGYGETGLEELLRELPMDSSIQARVEEEQLITTQGVFAPGDPLCCPSEVLQRFYTWDRTALVIEREEQEPAQ